MSVSVYIVGVIDADEKFNQMLNIYRLCEKCSVPVPPEVLDFFNDKPLHRINTDGMEIEIKHSGNVMHDEKGAIIQISDIPKNVKYFRVFCQ